LLLLPLIALGCSETPPSPLATVRLPAGVADGWVGTWGVAPQADGTAFQDKTLRHIVHTSIGGSSVRIRVSNVFGTQPLTLDSAYVAERANGAAIVPSTNRALKFAGQSSVTIPAGEATTSDAVAFEVAPLSDLAVSFHVASTNDKTTGHQTATQDNYVASGNVAGDESLSGAQVRGSYYFLSNVDVRNPEAWGAVVTLGASITDGVASGHNANRRWPNYLAQRLAAQGIPVGVLNQGISGNRLLANGAGESALQRFDRDVLSQTGVRWVIFSDDPINDLGSGSPPTAEQLIDGLKQLVMRAHAADVEFWCSTLTPFEGSGGWTPQGETARGAIHAFIASTESGCDAIVDQDNATHDPAKPTWFLPANDAGDHLHPNETGMQAIAGAVELNGFTAPESSGGAAGAPGGGSANAAGETNGAAGVAGAPAAGSSAGGNVNVAGTGGSSSMAGAGPSPGAGTASAGGASDGASTPTTGSGCSCHVSGQTPTGASLGSLMLLVLIAARRRIRD
jgi:MYXO-CTERM domain-containing protein